MFSRFIWTFRLILLIYFGVVYFFANTFFFVFLNLTLAYIPLEIAFFLTYKKRSAWLFWPLALVWLVFYPNSPYVLTDLLHLQRLNVYTLEGNLSPSMYIWKNFTFLCLGIFYGVFVGFLSLKLMINEIARRLNKQTSFYYQILLISFTILSSYGIYIGRFLRLHTINLITKPMETFLDLVFVFSPNFLAFVFYLSLLQYFLFTAVTKFISTYDSLKRGK